VPPPAFRDSSRNGFAVVDAELGAIPVCFVDDGTGFETDATTLVQRACEALPRYKTPGDSFLGRRNSSGDTKLKRNILKALARQLAAGSSF